MAWTHAKGGGRPLHPRFTRRFYRRIQRRKKRRENGRGTRWNGVLCGRNRQKTPYRIPYVSPSISMVCSEIHCNLRDLENAHHRLGGTCFPFSIQGTRGFLPHINPKCSGSIASFDAGFSCLCNSQLRPACGTFRNDAPFGSQ